MAPKKSASLPAAEQGHSLYSMWDATETNDFGRLFLQGLHADFLLNVFHRYCQISAI
jgi:hypothetical protein